MITTASMLLKWSDNHDVDLSELQCGEIFLHLLETGYGKLLDMIFHQDTVKSIHVDDLDVMWGNELVELLNKG